MAPEVQRAPARGIVELAPLIDTLTRPLFDVRREFVLLLTMDLEEFLSYHRGLRFQCFDPGKQCVVIKLNGRQLGIVEYGRPLRVDPLLAGGDIHTALKAGNLACAPF